jgi:tetratricopeptide (TPR) repeat protein
LAPEDKHLLQTAAVIGTDVPFGLLQAIADMAEAALHRSLAYLQAAEFLYETRLFPEREYTFKHALTHEVAYGSLLLERRRGLHVRLVAALEALAPERVVEQVDRLAHHAVRGTVWDKAVTYCRQAGARAARNRAAFSAALGYFDQALQALAHLPDHSDTRGIAIDLRLAFGGPLYALGEFGRWLTLLGEAEVLARALDDRTRLGWVLANIGQVRRTTGDLDGAMAACRQALELAVEVDDGALQRLASRYLGLVYNAIGDFGRAAELLRQNVAAGDPEPGTYSIDVWLQSQAWLARILGALGAFTEGRRRGEEALRLATLEGHGATPIIAHGCLGLLYLAQGDLEPAIQVLEPGLAWAMLLRCKGASRRGARCWRKRSAKISIRVRCKIMPLVSHGSARSAVWRDIAKRPGGTHARRSTWPDSRRNAGARHSCCTSLALSMPTPPPLMPSKLKPTTNRPWPWPRHSACARSWPTVTAAWAPCTPRPVSGSRPAPP